MNDECHDVSYHSDSCPRLVNPIKVLARTLPCHCRRRPHLCYSYCRKSPCVLFAFPSLDIDDAALCKYTYRIFFRFLFFFLRGVNSKCIFFLSSFLVKSSIREKKEKKKKKNRKKCLWFLSSILSYPNYYWSCKQIFPKASYVKIYKKNN